MFKRKYMRERLMFLEQLVRDQGLVVEGNVGEMIARKIEADEFHLSPDLNERQVHAVLACRIRYARIARGLK